MRKINSVYFGGKLHMKERKTGWKQIVKVLLVVALVAFSVINLIEAYNTEYLLTTIPELSWTVLGVVLLSVYLLASLFFTGGDSDAAKRKTKVFRIITIISMILLLLLNLEIQLAMYVLALDIQEGFEPAGYWDAKPVIYLYPEEETDVTVRLELSGEMTCSYPAYDDGWTVAAAPDGTLRDADDQTYNYLYWEGKSGAAYDFSEGFCVAGSETAAFLEDALARLGLTRREANEFIVYWLPLMQDNPYNLISFQTDAYAQSARLTVDPAPDTLLRVFMAWKPLGAEQEIAPQMLTAPERNGFTVVEWGGCKTEENIAEN